MPKNGKSTSQPKDFAEEVAGQDGAQAERLLSKAKKLGSATLGTITKQAVSRLLRDKMPLNQYRLFNDAERRQLAKAFASINSTADLLGRARIRRRQEQAWSKYGHSHSFAEKPTYKLRLIDATAFRSKSLQHQEFGLWATTYDFPDDIPPGEVWMDSLVDPIDRRYFMFNAEHVREARQAGMDQDDADDYGLAAERAERERNRLGGTGREPFHSQVPREIYVALWKVIRTEKETVKVYLVQGRIVRERYKTDWFSGGHAYVYPFIPEDEIWIEARQSPIERRLTLTHENNERTEMKHEEEGYDIAHDDSSVLEWKARQKKSSFTEFDPDKHPRGGNPENKGEFSKTSGGGESADNSGSQGDKAGKVLGNGDARAWEKIATPMQWKALREYTSDDNNYAPINDFMRHGGDLHPTLSSFMHEIEDLFHESPQWKEPRTVYRGIRMDEDSDDWKQLLENFKSAKENGTTVTMKGFTSTASDEWHAIPFAWAGMLVIDAKKGLDVRNASDLNEGEILLDNGCQYKVTDVEMESVPYASPPRKRWKIHLEQELGKEGCFAESKTKKKKARDTEPHFASTDPAEFEFEKPDSFSQEPTDFSCFAEPVLKPMAPKSAIDYFKKLIPRLNVDPNEFIQNHERTAFTMAEATDLQVLQKVQELIRKTLEGNAGQIWGPREIDGLLQVAGIHPKNPQYSEMVFRTNMMDSYNTGTIREMQEPDIAEDFPVWRYLGIKDGRQGKDHEPHFDQYFSNKVNFKDVRDSLVVVKGQIVPSGGRGRIFNCRCSPQPIYKSDWERLQKAGAKLKEWPSPTGFSEKMARLIKCCDFDPSYDL